MTIKKRITLDGLDKIIGERPTFGNNLKAERESREMTRREFSQLLNISIQSIADLEHERKIPSPERAAKIADQLGEPIAYWVELSIKDQLAKQNLKLDVKITDISA
ncbi:MAG: helix-turn-helix transcriptional regulator [Bacteriovoracaceae bacterium]|nr:helix-turn-helix transcriptional regulator [Bacteriovoracaceae bacterium]